MIKYTLKCSENHSFDSWFDSAEAYEKLERTGLLCCTTCGSENVKRAIMAPRVSASREATKLDDVPQLSPEKTLGDLRKKIESESENVGTDFAKEARKIHDGEAPARSIYGEAKLVDAKTLIEDGVPVVPLPWGKKRAN